MLRVRLLGGLELDLDGEPLAPPRSRRGRALLAWLALHPGAHARGAVAARFWPDVLDESARASLRVALSEIRAALGPAAACVVAGRDTVELGGDVAVDVRDLDGAIADGRAEAVAAIAGRPLLPELDDDWVHEARRSHDARVGELLRTLAQRAEDAGDVDTAIRHSRAEAALDPLAEAPVRRLVRRLALAGDRAAAIAEHDRFVTRLRTELGVAPSLATRQLAEELRADGTPPPPADAPALPAPVLLARAHESAFVGRDAELAQLRAAWQAKPLVLLAGEPGIGKTRLAACFAAEARERGAVVLAGRCWEEPLGPYAPFADVLAELRRALGDARVDALAGPAAAALGPLLGHAADLDEPGSRQRLFDAVDALLAALAAHGRVLLVLDDLHWADRATLLLLTYLVRSPRAAPVTVLGTYRDTDLGRHVPLSAVLHELDRERLAARIAVRGLQADDVAALARDWLGEASPEVAATVLDRTAGNALFAEEVLRGMAGDAEGAAPESVRQAVGARLSRLSPEANELLAVASAARGAFTPQLVAAAGDLDPRDAEAALDETLAARVLRPCAESPDALEFAHAVVRDVVYDELNALRRARVHRRIADALIDRGGDEHVEEIARHLLLAGAIGDEERTAAYLARAGRRAMALLDHDAAARAFADALEVGGADATLLCERGEALLHAGEPDAARACFGEAAGLARAAGDAAVLARAALGHAGLGVTIAAVDDVTTALLDEALRAVGDADPAVRARLLARLAVEQYYAPARDRSEALSQEAVAAATAAKDARTLAAVLGARHVALWRPDRLDERRAVADAMIDAARRAHDGPLELQGRNWRVVDLYELGDMPGWRAEVERHRDLADRLRLPTYQWYGALWEAVAALDEARFDEAAALADEAAAAGARAGDANAALFAEMLRIQSLWVRGRFEELDFDWVETKLAESPAAIAYVSGYAWSLAELGRPDEARAHLARLAADDFAALPFDTNWLSVMAEAASACIVLGDPLHADSLYRLLLPYAGRPLTAGRAVLTYGVADRYLGGLARLLGRDEDATAHLEAALAANAAMGLHGIVARTRHDLGTHLAAGPEPARGEQLRAQAAAEAEHLGIRL